MTRTPVLSLLLALSVFPHYFHTERDIFVSFVSSFHQPLHTSLLHLSPSVLLSYFKETWQQETVWLQRATWWRSVILGCPGSKMMVSTLQRAASDRSLSNGQLLKPWTMVCQNCLCSSHNQKHFSWLLAKSSLKLTTDLCLCLCQYCPLLFFWRSLYHRERCLELWCLTVGDLLPGNDALHKHDQPTDTRWGGER